jgi:hypothetical protein
MMSAPFETQRSPSGSSWREQLRANHPGQDPLTLRALFQAGHACGLEGEQLLAPPSKRSELAGVKLGQRNKAPRKRGRRRLVRVRIQPGPLSGSFYLQ